MADSNGLANATVVLSDSNGMVVASQITGSSGAYSFTNLSPGNYRVTETNPVNFLSSQDRDGGNDDRIDVLLTSGQAAIAQDFLDYTLGSIAGRVLLDENGDGVFGPNDTNGLSSVTVHLTDTNGMVLASGMTDGAGAFSFAELSPGYYGLMEIDDAGYQSTADRDGANDNMIAVDLTSGLDSTGNDFLDRLVPRGFTITKEIVSPTGPVLIGDPVVFSINLANTGGLDIASMRVSDLFDDAVLGFDAAMPGPDSMGAGSLQWDDIGPVRAGESTSIVVQFTALILTTGLSTNEAGASSEQPPLLTKRDEVAFRVFPIGIISGTVLEDQNFNGVIDPEDTNGIVAVSIVLTDTNLLPIATNQTDAMGFYLFTNLTPGAYILLEQDLPGYLSTGDIDGGDSNRIDVVLNAGQSSPSNDFYDVLYLAPTIICPSNVTLVCPTTNTSPTSTGMPQTGGNCLFATNQSLQVWYTDVITPDCGDAYTITRTWRVNDACGGSNSCDQTIQVQDDTAPTIILPSSITIECDASTTPVDTGMATATDSCSSTVTVTYVDQTSTSICPQVITRSWSAVDACGNAATNVQTITLVDTTDPVVAVPNDVTIECDASSAPGNTGMATVTDNCSTNITLQFSDASVSSCPTLLTRSWIGMDECGNVSTQMQLITIQDTTLPVLALPLDITIECDQPTDPQNTGMATATDNCTPAVNMTFSDVPSVVNCETIITRTWRATDACGNETAGDQAIHLVDTTNPVLMLPPDVTIECGAVFPPPNPALATAVDNCSTNLTPTFRDGFLTPPCSFWIERVWQVADDCGNAVTATQIFMLVDTKSPVLSVPADITVTCGESIVPTNTGVAVSIDACAGNLDPTYVDQSVTNACTTTITRNLRGNHHPI
ncbi:hypothetical protein ES703_44396 [subsurface metagenome]